MTIERIAVEEIMGENPKVVPMTTETQTKPQKTQQQMEAEYSAILAAMQVAAKIIAVRFFLFLSLVGSFALAIMAVNNQTSQSAYVLLLYACVTTLPLTVLEIVGKRGG